MFLPFLPSLQNFTLGFFQMSGQILKDISFQETQEFIHKHFRDAFLSGKAREEIEVMYQTLTKENAVAMLQKVIAIHAQSLNQHTCKLKCAY